MISVVFGLVFEVTSTRDLGGDGYGGYLEVGRPQSVELRQLGLAGPVTQTSDLERLGRLYEGGQHVLGHVGLALVHVLHQALEVVELNVLHNDHWMLVIQEGRFEKLLK